MRKRADAIREVQNDPRLAPLLTLEILLDIRDLLTKTSESHEL